MLFSFPPPACAFGPSPVGLPWRFLPLICRPLKRTSGLRSLRVALAVSCSKTVTRFFFVLGCWWGFFWWRLLGVSSPWIAFPALGTGGFSFLAEPHYCSFSLVVCLELQDTTRASPALSRLPPASSRSVFFLLRVRFACVVFSWFVFSFLHRHGLLGLEISRYMSG